MKDNPLDGHRGKVANGETSKSASSTESASGKGGQQQAGNEGSPAAAPGTNFDDDYNEWELGIGDLIIDLDADIEKNNEKQNGICGLPSTTSPTSPGNSSLPCSISGQVVLPAGMSNSKSSRMGASAGGVNSSATTGAAVSQSAAAPNAAGAVEHQATVDKGLKMKIKRKNVGSKSSEAKHEIVQSDTTSKLTAVEGTTAPPTSLTSTSNAPAAGTPNPGPQGPAAAQASAESKSKHSSGKGRSGSHRDKKEKSRDKEKNKSGDVNGVGGGATTALPPNTPAIKISSVSLTSLTASSTSALTCLSATPTAQTSGATGIVISGVTGSNQEPSSGGVAVPSGANLATSNSGNVTNCANSTASGGGGLTVNGPTVTVSSIPNLTVKLEPKYGSPSNSSTTAPCSPANCSVISKMDELPKSPPVKRVKTDRIDRVDGGCSPIPPEMQDTGTCTSIGTVTEPECLGPCEPGTSVLLEGIVWQETEGAGVLVVNVTWRGKTYVGTLLDCTRHDWAPPRLCESPISDMDAKAVKGRGKRGRGSATAAGDGNETRATVQSKLRNGKGRRNSGFTVPTSPARGAPVADSAGKRKGRPADLDLSPSSADSKGKRSRTQSRNTPTPGSSTAGNSVDFSQPSSPMLIECPEPNCSKKYKHINGLRYHQTHAHSGNQESASSTQSTTVTALQRTTDEAALPANEDIKEAVANVETEENMEVTASDLLSQSTTGNTSSLPTSSPSNSETVPAIEQAPPIPSPIINTTPTATPTVVDTYSMNSDLSTLANVAISESATSSLKSSVSNSTMCFPAAIQQQPSPGSIPNSTSAIDSTKPSGKLISGSQPPLPSHVKPEPYSIPVSSSSVIQPPPNSSVVIVPNGTALQTPSVTVSIPTSHVMSFNGQMATSLNSGTTLVTNTQTASFASNSNSHAISNLTVPSTFSNQISASDNTYSSSQKQQGAVPSGHNHLAPLSLDKSKIKQEKQPDRYKSQKPTPGTPLSSNLAAVRPLASAPLQPGQSVVVPSNIPPSHMGINSHQQSAVNSGGPLLTASLKPIQPKPTILGEPTTLNPSLESLKKEKSKHKKKCKDKEKKLSGLNPSTTPAKVQGLSGMCQTEAGERLESLGYHMAESIREGGVGNSPGAPSSQQQPGTVSSLCSLGAPPSARSLDLSIDPNTPESTMNENVQSPAYSDISDANDTAPVLESEVVVSEKEKEDKALKAPSEAAPSPSGNLTSYGMYSYYGQPPYLIPSVPPQNSSPSAEKMNPDSVVATKKPETERTKEPSKISSWGTLDMTIDSRVTPEQPQPSEQNRNQETKKTSSRVEDLAASSVPPVSAGPPNTGLPDYQQSPIRQSPLQQQPSIQQSYPYTYGYMQGFPYGMDPAFHMHMLTNDPHYKQQHDRIMHEQERMYKDQQHHQQSERRSSIGHGAGNKESSSQERRDVDSRGLSRHSELKRASPSSSSLHYGSRDRDSSRESRDSQSSNIMLSNHIKRETPPSSSPSTAAASLKEKQSENHQILKENIELKSQMDSGKAKYSHYEAVLIERQREEMRRYYLMPDQMMDQESAIYHQQQHGPQNRKDENSHGYPPMPQVGKQQSVIESRGNPSMSPQKEHISKNVHGSSSNVSSPKIGLSNSAFRDSHHGKEHSKKDSNSSSRSSESHHDGLKEEKSKSEKLKSLSHGEGQKPTMETTGPPPPPTNSYAYLHPSYLQPPPHFAHMPFDHPMYRGGLNPILMSAGPAAAYGGSPYLHPQLRYHVPHAQPPSGPCDLNHAPQPPAADPHHHHHQKMHSTGGQPGTPVVPKALDLLHQVSQHYTTHKIHELQERALMSPSTTPNSVGAGSGNANSTNPTPTTTPNSGSNAPPSGGGPTTNHSTGKSGGSEQTNPSTKQESGIVGDSRSRSPPPQRHLHTHHHTHVGVGYPIYDPYGVNPQHWKQAQAQRRVPFRLTNPREVPPADSSRTISGTRTTV